MAVVAWNEADFLAMYPRFAMCGAQAVPSAQLAALFDIACSIVDNTDGSLIPYDPANGIYVRQVVLYALVCHLATLDAWGANGQNGAVASASEGSVSVSFSLPSYQAGGDLATWLRQTPCGQTAWILLSRFAKGGRVYAVKHIHPFG